WPRRRAARCPPGSRSRRPAPLASSQLRRRRPGRRRCRPRTPPPAPRARSRTGAADRCRGCPDRPRAPSPPRRSPPGRARLRTLFRGELRKRDILPLRVLHFTSGDPSYGNALTEAIAAVTQGVLHVNPNTTHPLLRQLESRGLLEGRWEHPERRSRRYYSLTSE